MAETYAPQLKSDLGQLFSEFLTRLDGVLRRVMDIGVSVLGLLVLSPIFLFFGLLIKRDSPGPVFYRGRRMGKDGREFKILKFRTMYETQASYSGPSLTCEGDARITGFGQWLRDTKMNELPQLWNVLVGQMSLVGPRPEDFELAQTWPAQVRAELLSVRPGITSPASIVYRNLESLLTRDNLMGDYFQQIVPSKHRLDRAYIKKRTLLTDLDVIFLTALALLPVLRDRAMPEYLLFWGPIARVTSRFGLWFMVDWLVALGCTWVAGLFWRALGPFHIGVGESFIISIAIAVLFSLTNQLLGLNNIAWSKAGVAEGTWVVVSGGIGTLVLVLLDRLVFGQHFFPTGMILVAGALAIGGFGIVRYRERLITSLASRWVGTRKDAASVGERVLIVGAGEMGDWAKWVFTHGDFAKAFSIVGMVDDDPRKIGMVVNGVKILGDSANIPALVKKLDIGVVVFAIHQIEPAERERIILLCQRHEIKLVLFPNLMELLRASMLPEQAAILAAAERNELNGVLERVQKEEVGSWMDEVDGLLAAQDIYGARALLASMKAHFDPKKECL
jgi:lipopolysaccharide/colanic/teichoic acid biosynthesis glycosyltransferase